MKNKYGIGFFAFTIIAVLVITCAYQFSYYRAKDKALEVRLKEQEEEKRAEERLTEKKKEEAVAAEGEALKEDCYYLMEVNGYIVVYLSDKKTPYEYTDILYDELPDGIREEIRNGKYIEDTETLYGFLENYSS